MKTIYCIMITNKSRERFISSAIKNFELQTYKEKKLIVLNHSFGTTMINNKDVKNIHEFVVNKDQQKFSLGKLRNIALKAFVPVGGLWTPFDDDDWHREDFLEEFQNRLEYANLDLLFLKNRLECNMNNGFIFRSKFMNGWAFFLARRIEVEGKIELYDDVETLEDSHVGERYRNAGKKVGKFENDPKIYVRMIHTTNSSIFVRKEKSSIVEYGNLNNYQEFDANEEEKGHVRHVIKNYYKDVVKDDSQGLIGN